jgi:hypothetical protein
MRKTIGYSIAFFVLMSLALFLHIQLMPYAQTFIMQSYFLNGLMAVLSILLLRWGMQNKNNNLTNFYLITVALKLASYFLFFRPQFEIDGILIRSEAFIFLAPYSLGLVFEITLLARRYS